VDTGSLFEHLRRFDTPTIANALEIARGQRIITGFTRQTLIAALPQLPPVVGFARTVTIRSATPYDPAVRRKNQLAYYEYLAQPQQPTIAVVQDIDSQPGIGKLCISPACATEAIRVEGKTARTPCSRPT